MQEYYNEPRNEAAFPTTVKAADGIHTLQRFRVDAVIYAPTLEDAKRMAKEANIYLSAARVVGEGRS